MPVTTSAISGVSGARITGIGTHVPGRVLTNADLEKMVDTTDEWIVTRTGIRERRIAAGQEFTSHLAIAAVQNMMDRYGVSVDDVDMILACTHTPDFPFPGVACLVQRHFRIGKAGAVDLNATCAGFVYGLAAAAGMIGAGLCRKVLVIAGDTMSKITDYRTAPPAFCSVTGQAPCCWSGRRMRMAVFCSLPISDPTAAGALSSTARVWPTPLTASGSIRKGTFGRTGGRCTVGPSGRCPPAWRDCSNRRG
jgi:3-oxoacyl-(acyl-carrier-protein) synthase III